MHFHSTLHSQYMSFIYLLMISNSLFEGTSLHRKGRKNRFYIMTRLDIFQTGYKPKQTDKLYWKRLREEYLKQRKDHVID